MYDITTHLAPRGWGSLPRHKGGGGNLTSSQWGWGKLRPKMEWGGVIFKGEGQPYLMPRGERQSCLAPRGVGATLPRPKVGRAASLTPQL